MVLQEGVVSQQVGLDLVNDQITSGGCLQNRRIVMGDEIEVGGSEMGMRSKSFGGYC